MPKTRKQLEFEYQDKYSEIPIDYNQRLEWMFDKYKITDSKAQDIINTRNMMMSQLYYNDIIVILFEEVGGAKRPRTRLINRQNIYNEAVANSNFIHVYSPDAKEDNLYMKKLIDSEIVQLNSMIYTPCIIEYNTFTKTPSVFNSKDKYLAEIGLIRPITKPDFDNIAKKYSDMFNHNIWLDDTLVISGTVNKFYSILPRIEIRLRYLNTLYNKYQYNSMSKRTDMEITYFEGGQNK